MKRDDIQEVVRLSPVLRELDDSDQPLQQSEIRERVRKSKSTTHRRMNKLEGMGFVSKEGDGYSLTDLGETVAERTEEYVSEVRAAHEYEEFLETVNETDLSLSDISDAEVTHASDENPVAPFLRLAEVTKNASEVRVLTNSVAPKGFEAGRERLREGEQGVEMVLDERTLESILESDLLGEGLEEDLGTGNLSIWVHGEPVPYQIGIMDDSLCLGSEDENRMPVAVLETENDAAVEWAERTFEEHRKRSRRLEPDDI